MAEQRKALGRGISSLIRKSPKIKAQQEKANTENAAIISNAHAHKDGLVEIPLSEIVVNPRQPRRYFNPQLLQDLKKSIEASGVLQPILVRRASTTGYELIAGERRFRASKLAGKTSIPALIKSMTDQVQLEVAIVENLQRQDLTAIEEAKGYERLAIEFGLTQEQIAKKVGKERSTVSNLMRLLKLAPLVQSMVNEGRLNMGHARALLAFDSVMDQERAAQKIVKEGLSVRAVERMVKDASKPKVNSKASKARSSLDPNLKFIQNKLQQSLGTKVELEPSGKGGVIRIQYFNSDDLHRIQNQLQS